MLGPAHPEVANSLNNLAQCYVMQNKYDLAEPLFRQALTIWEQTSGLQPAKMITTLRNFAYLLGLTKRELEARELEIRVRAMIAANVLGNRMHDQARNPPSRLPKRKPTSGKSKKRMY